MAKEEKTAEKSTDKTPPQYVAPKLVPDGKGQLVEAPPEK